MIVQIEGSVIDFKVKDEVGSLDLMTSAGLGYRVFVPVSFTAEVDSEVVVHTSFQVREDSQSLYGFPTPEERDFFETLISVSGIGPKIGLAILSMYGVEKVKELILATDHVTLSKVKGLGAKGSKKIILELSGVLASEESDDKSSIGADSALIKELRDALKALGFSGGDSKEMLEKGKKIVDESPDIVIEDLLQKVLRS